MVKFKIEKVEENGFVKGFMTSGKIEGETDVVLEELAVGVDNALMQLAEGDKLLKEILCLLFVEEFTKKVHTKKEYKNKK